jgi:hypothetical protein
MPTTLIPISQHFAVWDVHRGSGWVSLHDRGRVVARADIDDIDDFDTILSMLSDRRGLCFDARREVLKRVPGTDDTDDGRGR